MFLSEGLPIFRFIMGSEFFLVTEEGGGGGGGGGGSVIPYSKRTKSSASA